MEEDLVNPHWLINTRITPSFPWNRIWKTYFLIYPKSKLLPKSKRIDLFFCCFFLFLFILFLFFFMFLFLQWTQGGFGAREKRLGKEKNENLLKITFMIVPEGDVCSLELNFQLFWSNFSVFLPHRMENQVILQLAGEKNQGPTLFTPKWTWMWKCRGMRIGPIHSIPISILSNWLNVYSSRFKLQVCMSDSS